MAVRLAGGDILGIATAGMPDCKRDLFAIARKPYNEASTFLAASSLTH